MCADRITSETTVATPTVEGRTLRIDRLTWSESVGLSFEVYDTETGVCLTEDGAFDEMPTSLQLTALVQQAERDGRFDCHQCGGPMMLTDTGVSHHLLPGSDGIDWDRDLDHVAYHTEP
jgi:hypothetical protein